MFTIYSLSTGEIFHTFVGDGAFLDINTPAGSSALLGDYINTLYRIDLALHEPVLKVVMPYSLDFEEIDANGEDVATISGFPGGAVAVLEGVEHEIGDGTIEFTADTPGLHRIALRHPLYLDTVVEITAV